MVSFNELRVINLIEEYRSNPALLDNFIVFDDGIGRELMQYVISEAKKAKKHRIFLWVIKENLSARKFYEANEFKENGETCLIEGTTKLDMCYELILD